MNPDGSLSMVAQGDDWYVTADATMVFITTTVERPQVVGLMYDEAKEVARAISEYLGDHGTRSIELERQLTTANETIVMLQRQKMAALARLNEASVAIGLIRKALA